MLREEKMRKSKYQEKIDDALNDLTREMNIKDKLKWEKAIKNGMVERRNIRTAAEEGKTIQQKEGKTGKSFVKS